MVDSELNAQYLQAHSSQLRPRGPMVNVVFTGNSGPIGMQIVNISCRDEDFEFDRVVVVAAESDGLSFNKVFFGDQIMYVGKVNCLGMKMKQVKLMIIDAPRPLSVWVQPLCILSKTEEFPLVPPMPISQASTQLVWGLMARSFALQHSGAPRTVNSSHIRYATIDNLTYFVLETTAEAAEGELIVQCNGVSNPLQLGQELEKATSHKQYVLQPVCVKEMVQCANCQHEEWIFSRFCSGCGIKSANCKRA